MSEDSKLANLIEQAYFYLGGAISPRLLMRESVKLVKTIFLACTPDLNYAPIFPRFFASPEVSYQ